MTSHLIRRLKADGTVVPAFWVLSNDLLRIMRLLALHDKNNSYVF